MTERQFEILIDLIYTVASLYFSEDANPTKCIYLRDWREKWFGEEKDS